MKITITITCDNDAFAGDPWREAARILAAVAKRQTLHQGFKLFDANGNTVGSVEVLD